MIKEYDPLIPAGLIYVPEYYSDKYLYYINEKLQNNDVVDFISINLKNSLNLFSSCKFDYSKYKILGYYSGDFRKLKAEDATIRRCLSNMPNDKFTNIIIENFN